MTGRSRPTLATDGGQRVLFEETLHIQGREGANCLIGLTRGLFGFMIIAFVISTVLVGIMAVSMFGSAFGGVEAIWSFARDVYARQPLLIAAFAVPVVLMILFFLVGVFGMKRGMRKAFSEQVTVRLTESELSVRQEGGGPGRYGE